MTQEELLATARWVEVAESFGPGVQKRSSMAWAGFTDTVASGLVSETMVRSTDGYVAPVVLALPGSHLSIHSRVRPWTASVRRSSCWLGVDDALVLGTGAMPRLPQAMLAAPLGVGDWG